MVMLQGIRIDLFIRRLGLIALRHKLPILIWLGLVSGIVAERDKMIVLANVSVHILKSDAIRVLLAPIVERRADGLGDLEAGNVMAAETTIGANRLLADVPFEPVFPRLIRHVF